MQKGTQRKSFILAVDDEPMVLNALTRRIMAEQRKREGLDLSVLKAKDVYSARELVGVMRVVPHDCVMAIVDGLNGKGLPLIEELVTALPKLTVKVLFTGEGLDYRHGELADMRARLKVELIDKAEPGVLAARVRDFLDLGF